MIARVSDYRTYLMGISILWIILFHTAWYLWFPKVIEIFQRSGNYGVDIFIFVSVYGLYRSMQNHRTLRQWYVRRLKRIIPSFLIVTTMLAFIESWSVVDYIKEIAFIGFLLPNIKYEVVFWYIPAILIFYAIFPYVYKYRKKHIIYLFIPLAYIFTNYFTHYIQRVNCSLFLCFFFMRIPIFLIGLLYADNEEKLMSLCEKKHMFAIIVLSVVCFLLFLAVCNKWIGLTISNQQSLYIIGSLPFLCFVSYVLQEKVKILNPIALFCGRYSLQLYLLHVAYINIILHVDFFSRFNQIYMFVIAILLSFPSAFLLSKIEGCIINLIDGKK